MVKPKPLMKKLLALFLLIFLSFSCRLMAQESSTAPGNSGKRSVIYEVPWLNAGKTFPMFRDFASTKPGIVIRGFCESRNLLLLELNDDGRHICEQWFRDQSFSFYEKVQVPLEDALKSCGGDAEFYGSFNNE